MSGTSLGTWRNPPLAYVVAELVISPYYSMASKVPGLQDRLRNAFPRTLEAKEVLLEANKPSALPLWRLISEDQKQGVQVGTRAVSLHATTYLNSDDFLSRWADVLDAIKEASLGAFVERAGLRYIDLIVPSDDRSPADYMAPTLQGITPEGSRSTGSMWAAAFQFDATVVNLRAAAPAPQGLVLPPDFNALPLSKPQVMLDAELRLKEDRSIGFIDTDCLKELNRVLDAADLMSVYAEMQKLASRTFGAALSEVAKREWV